MSGDINIEARLLAQLRSLETGGPIEGPSSENDIAYLQSLGYIEEVSSGFGFWKRHGWRITPAGRDYISQLASLKHGKPPLDDTSAAVGDMYDSSSAVDAMHVRGRAFTDIS
jgi:hypothetical protein